MALIDTIERAGIAAELRRASLPEPERLASLALRSWHLLPTRTTMDQLAVGQSRFGGGPDYPADFVWPTRDGRRLSFLAQLDLSEVGAPDLPSTGWLLFFYDAEEQPWGFDPKDAGGTSVVYLEGPRASLVQRQDLDAEGDDDEPRFNACALTIRGAVELPEAWDSLVSASVPLQREQEGTYNDVALAVRGQDEDNADYANPHLLGQPQLVQSDMRVQCEEATNGVYVGDGETSGDELDAALRARAPHRWRLLLQLETDEEQVDWMWGMTGRIYFWIPAEDLGERRFDRVWAIVQSGLPVAACVWVDRHCRRRGPRDGGTLPPREQRAAGRERLPRSSHTSPIEMLSDHLLDRGEPLVGRHAVVVGVVVCAVDLVQASSQLLVGESLATK